MKVSKILVAGVLIAAGWATGASADPHKGHGGHDRWREGRYERHHDFDRHHHPRGRAYGYYSHRHRDRHAFRDEYRRGRCTVERTWQRNGGYREEVRCRDGRRPYPAYGFRY